jgi:hypothetical protein
MTVYVDTAENRFGRMIMGHMVADSIEELHAMADRIGLRRRWFQANASTPHYDVSKSMRSEAIRFGAVELDRRAFVGVLRRLRAERMEMRT